MEWFDLGEVENLKKVKCRRLWADSGNDLALFHIDGDKFFITSAKCPHANGPLEQGDIEDLGDGRYRLTCPIHFYSFDLPSGASELHNPLKVEVFKTEVRDGRLFVQNSEPVSVKRKPKGTPVTLPASK